MAMAYGCLVFASSFFHSKKKSAGTRQRRRFKASRYVGLVVMVSALALIVLNAILASFAQKGTRPQRMTVNSRPPVSESSLTHGRKLWSMFKNKKYSGTVATAFNVKSRCLALIHLQPPKLIAVYCFLVEPLSICGLFCIISTLVGRR